jgi:peptidyl-prolyl cis-trans isomerase C
MRRPSLPAAAAALLLSTTAAALAQAPATRPAPPAARPAAPPAAPAATPPASPVAPAPATPAATPPAAPPTQPAAPAVAAAPAAPADPIVARVGNEEIHASELSDAAQGLPEELRGMPAPVLFPMLLDQLVDRRAIVIAARRDGLDRDPAVRRQVARATDTALQNALLTREIAPGLTDEAIKARYDRDIAGKAGEPEAHARHILVADEDTAKRVIAELKGGADFAELAKKNSTDPAGSTNGGDLGFFKRGDMLPEFAEAAFNLQPGAITEVPVKTRFGWHVIKLEGLRTAPPPAFEQVRDEVRQQLIQEGVTRVLAAAKQGIPVQKFNLDGTPMVDAPAQQMPGAPAAPGNAPPAVRPAAPPAPGK